MSQPLYRARQSQHAEKAEKECEKVIHVLTCPDRGEPPMPAGTVERERRVPMDEPDRADRWSDGWLDRLCQADVSAS